MFFTSWGMAPSYRGLRRRCEPFTSGTVASKVRSASGEWPSLADDWKHGWTACSSVAGVRLKTGGWRIIFYESARLCSRSSIVLVWRPPTGGQNRPSARWWSRARSGVATAPSPELERKASRAVFCKPVASNSVLYPLPTKTGVLPET
jgi:hypothetical protein